jgi:hypothetical protein
MKGIAKYLVPILGLVWISFHLGCRTLSTTAGAPPSGSMNGMLYYLPIGKITIKGEFKEVTPTPTPCPTCTPKPSPAKTEGGNKDADAQAAAPPTATTAPGNARDGESTGVSMGSASQLTITLTPEVEADEAAGEYYVTPHANYVYEDEARVTVNPKHLLSTGNVTTEDKTVEIVGALASIAAEVTTKRKEVPKEKIQLPFYFSFHPSNPAQVERVRKALDERGITFGVESPTPVGKSIGVTAPKAKQLGEQGLLFRPATSYKVMLAFAAVDPRDKNNKVSVIDGTQQFILPDPARLYEIEYPRMAFVKKVKEIGFTDGMLTDFHHKLPSPILGFLGIPKAILQAMVPIPGAPSSSGSASGSGTTPPKN